MKTEIIGQCRDKMEKALEAFRKEASKTRTGRASTAVLENVRVDYYGQMVPISQVATLGVPEPRMITIAPWQSNLIPVIEKAIEKANLGLSPSNDGKLIRLPIPPLNEERRREVVKMLKNHAEESKVQVRHVRRDSLEFVKKNEKEGKITEDDSKKISADVQKLTDEYISKIDQVVQNKEKEIMEV